MFLFLIYFSTLQLFLKNKFPGNNNPNPMCTMRFQTWLYQILLQSTCGISTKDRFYWLINKAKAKGLGKERLL